MWIIRDKHTEVEKDEGGRTRGGTKGVRAVLRSFLQNYIPAKKRFPQPHRHFSIKAIIIISDWLIKSDFRSPDGSLNVKTSKMRNWVNLLKQLPVVCAEYEMIRWSHILDYNLKECVVFVVIIIVLLNTRFLNPGEQYAALNFKSWNVGKLTTNHVFGLITGQIPKGISNKKFHLILEP